MGIGMKAHAAFVISGFGAGSPRCARRLDNGWGSLEHNVASAHELGDAIGCRVERGLYE